MTFHPPSRVPEQIRSILVIKPSSLGDIIHCFPALEVLHQLCPQAELDFLVAPAFASLLDFSPFPVRNRILFKRRELGKVKSFFPEIIKLIRSLSANQYDLVVDFQGLLRSSIAAGFASRRKNIAGFAEPREKISRIFYGTEVKTASYHAVAKNVELVNGIFESSFSVPASPDLSCLSSPAGSGYLLMFPGARWESKKYPLSLYSEIARAAVEKKIKVVLSGSPDEEPDCEEIIRSTGSDMVLSLAGKTGITDLFGLCANASAVVCNDSGPLHIAAYTGRPVFTFFGPTCPEKTGPWGKSGTVYRNTSVSCLGCLKRNCPLPETLCQKIDHTLVIRDILKVISTDNS